MNCIYGEYTFSRCPSVCAYIRLSIHGYQKTKLVATLKKYGRHHGLVNPCIVAVSKIVSDVFANDEPSVDFQNSGHTLQPTFPSFRPMGMVGEACLPTNAYYPRTPDYTLYSGVHVCWFEHSDSSFVYGFMNFDYGLGTMTITTYVLVLARVYNKHCLLAISCFLCDHYSGNGVRTSTCSKPVSHFRTRMLRS